MAVLERLSTFVGKDLSFKNQMARATAEAGLESNSKSKGKPLSGRDDQRKVLLNCLLERG